MGHRAGSAGLWPSWRFSGSSPADLSFKWKTSSGKMTPWEALVLLIPVVVCPLLHCQSLKWAAGWIPERYFLLVSSDSWAFPNVFAYGSAQIPNQRWKRESCDLTLSISELMCFLTGGWSDFLDCGSCPISSLKPQRKKEVLRCEIYQPFSYCDVEPERAQDEKKKGKKLTNFKNV